MTNDPMTHYKESQLMTNDLFTNDPMTKTNDSQLMTNDQ
jgi:hypothetical protein